jgi:hypothetical protein
LTPLLAQLPIVFARIESTWLSGIRTAPSRLDYIQ